MNAKQLVRVVWLAAMAAILGGFETRVEARPQDAEAQDQQDKKDEKKEEKKDEKKEGEKKVNGVAEDKKPGASR